MKFSRHHLPPLAEGWMIFSNFFNQGGIQNFKGLVGHKGGSKILTLRGIEFPVMKILRGGGDCLISSNDFASICDVLF